MVTLKPLTTEDVVTIRKWAPYPERLFALDYALRQGGWLDTFLESPTTRRFGVHDGDELVGFTLLTDISNLDAEFYIALHPDKLGQGIGKAATELTVAVGFDQLGLRRIHLKVRDWHKGARRLYESVGFRACGTAVVDIQGKPVSFDVMEIYRTDNATNPQVHEG